MRPMSWFSNFKPLLMQMAKPSAALKRLAQAHLPFISAMTNPSTGGVTASLTQLLRMLQRRPPLRELHAVAL
jgi:acetyl-CoA carboxylase beta subunit